MVPPPPIMLTEEKWPLLTVAKGDFDNLGKDSGLASAAALSPGWTKNEGMAWKDGEMKLNWRLMNVGDALCTVYVHMCIVHIQKCSRRILEEINKTIL